MRMVTMIVCTLFALTPACAVNSSGCENFDPKSPPLAVDEAVTVDVEIIGDRVSTLDVNGGYYVQPDDLKLRAPAPVEPPRRKQGVVRRGAAGLTLLLDEQSIPLEGPLGCD
jgi:hypothetical protein